MASIFKSMVKACKFHSVDYFERINPHNFPIECKPDENTEYVLVSIDHEMSTDGVTAKINGLGLEPAILADLLLYVRKNRDELSHIPIVALDSVYDGIDYKCWPCVSAYGRRLDLAGAPYGWANTYKFLAKKPRKAA